jgi:hypothetical protein
MHREPGEPEQQQDRRRAEPEQSPQPLRPGNQRPGQRDAQRQRQQHLHRHVDAFEEQQHRERGQEPEHAENAAGRPEPGDQQGNQGVQQAEHQEDQAIGEGNLPDVLRRHEQGAPRLPAHQVHQHLGEPGEHAEAGRRGDDVEEAPAEWRSTGLVRGAGHVVPESRDG